MKQKYPRRNHMNHTERKLTEAIGNLFRNSRAKLGIIKTDQEEISHRYEAQWNDLEYKFALKTIDSPFSESLTGAFRDIHSYKYLEDPTFPIALKKRLSATGIPEREIQKAIEILESLKDEKTQEKEIGWHPNMKEIKDVTTNADQRTPKHKTPYTGGGPAPQPNEIK